MREANKRKRRRKFQTKRKELYSTVKEASKRKKKRKCQTKRKERYSIVICQGTSRVPATNLENI